MSITGSVPARGKRHPMTVVTRARQLAEAGWKPAEIRRLLERDGTTVSLATVSRWVNPDAHRRWSEQAQRWNARRAASRGAAGGAARRNARPEFKLARLQLLRESGLSCRATAIVLGLDFGDTFSEEQIRRAERLGRYPGGKPGRPRKDAVSRV